MTSIHAFGTRASVPVAGTPAGDRVRDSFIAQFHALVGGPDNVRPLWLPKTTDTTTTTSEDKDASVFTYDATIASSISTQGSGVGVDFDASADEADVPYSADFFFGDGTSDEPFSVVALVSADDTTPAAAATILSVWNKDTDGEQRHWRTFLTATNGYPTIESYDESANAFIGRQDQTALADTNPHLLVFTKSGAVANDAFNVFVDGAELDDANSSSGSYTAQEDPGSAEKLLLAHTLSAAATPVAEEFWNGKLYVVALVAKELNEDEIWGIKALCNSFFDLAL